MSVKPDDLPCQEFVEMVTDYLESALPPDLCESLEAHLAICDGCRLYLGQMRLSVRALQRVADGELPLSLRQKLLEQFRRPGM